MRNLLPGWVENVAKENGRKQNSTPKVAFSSTVSRDIPTKRGFGMTKVAFSSTVCGDIPTEWRSVVLFHAKERYRSIAGESEEDPAVSGLDRRYILSHFQCVSFHGR